MYMIINESRNRTLSFKLNGEELNISGHNREILRKLANFCYERGYKFPELSEEEVMDKIKKTTLTKSSFHKLPSGFYISGLDNANDAYLSRIADKWLSNIGDVSNISLENEESIQKFKDFKNYTTTTKNTNPFQQAICVLGDSGAGKSYSIENILKAEGHEYDFIIPTAATTGLLAQYSPRKKEYVPSRLSKLIIGAYENPQDLYTVVFDECHKSNVIEMINDELLQAISIRRNDGRRFISLDSDTAEQVFDETDIEIGRNIQIPDNLGFIFISSNPRVIGGNPDFFNRVDLVEITEDNRNDFKSSDDLLEKSLKVRSEKLELIEKLRSV